MKNPHFLKALDMMREIHERKNADYSVEDNPFSNFEFAAAHAGVTVDQVFLVLDGIKIARMKNLQESGKKPNNESLLDTFMDRATYATIHWAYQLKKLGILALALSLLACDGYSKIDYTNQRQTKKMIDCTHADYCCEPGIDFSTGRYTFSCGFKATCHGTQEAIVEYWTETRFYPSGKQKSSEESRVVERFGECK